MTDSNIHTGHRKRERATFLDRGLDGLPGHKVLELLLYHSIPRGDVNPLAHELIKQFGSISGVLNADYDQLMEVSGVGERTAFLIRLVSAINAYALKEQASKKEVLKSQQEVQAYLAAYFFGTNNEKAYLLCLDAKGKILVCQQLSENSPTATEICLRDIVKIALKCNASNIILAHNHLTGIPHPSSEDLQTTQYLHEKLRELDLNLWDHLIFVDDFAASMRALGCLRD